MKNYHQTIDYLFHLQRHGIKLTLDNIKTLLQPLNNPQNDYPCIHIAGTNGKGSTAAMLESILMKAGYKVGLYTSPHLVDFRERIRINRVHIPEQEVISFTQKMQPLIDDISPSFFEATTALAFDYFAKEKVDIAIIEVGLGGRLDSTNVITPLLSIITSIDMDHQKYLGDTITQIASEKAGIIKPNVPCITNNRNKEILEVLRRRCLELNSDFVNVNEAAEYQIFSMDLSGTFFKLRMGEYLFNELHLNLPGDYQIDNALLVVGALIHLKDKLKFDRENVVEGLKNVRWKGRINLISREPTIVVDVSHNASGFERTLSFLKNHFPKENLAIFTALQEDKDFQRIGELLSCYSDTVYIVNIKKGKPLNPAKLSHVLIQRGVNAKILDSFDDVPEQISNHGEEKSWLIIGSHYLAGEAYEKLPQAITDQTVVDQTS